MVSNFGAFTRYSEQRGQHQEYIRMVMVTVKVLVRNLLALSGDLWRQRMKINRYRA